MWILMIRQSDSSYPTLTNSHIRSSKGVVIYYLGGEGVRDLVSGCREKTSVSLKAHKKPSSPLTAKNFDTPPEYARTMNFKCFTYKITSFKKLIDFKTAAKPSTPIFQVKQTLNHPKSTPSPGKKLLLPKKTEHEP